MKRASQQAIEAALRARGVEVEALADEGDSVLFALRDARQPTARVVS